MVENGSVQKGTETILVIDDEESVLVGIEFMLVKLGYTVHSADNGQKAIEIFKSRWQEIDLVILDLVMPQMLGTEVFDKLREIDPECRVLMASGYSSEEDAQALIEKGCLGYLQKPFNIDRLSTRIREILDR
jgi:DNA-binding NtrC family response regulator